MSLKYPNINGYRLGEEIGGGGFSKWVARHRELLRCQHCLLGRQRRPIRSYDCTGTDIHRVFRAIDDAHSRVAACKVVNLFISPTLGYGVPNQKELQKEVQVHRSLQHDYILSFIHHELVPQDREAEGWVPGLYMLLELAIGGDLFDKIGTSIYQVLASGECGTLERGTTGDLEMRS